MWSQTFLTVFLVSIAGSLNLAQRQLPDIDGPGVAASARYHGGSDFEFAEGLAVDAMGNAYVLGRTFSSDWHPSVTPVAESAGERATALFLLKVSPDGQPIYAVTLGTGFSFLGEDIAVSRDGSVHVLARRGDVAHIVKIDGSTGRRIYQVTYDAFARNGISPKAIAADDTGGAVLAGWSSSAGGIFVARLDGGGRVFAMQAFPVAALVNDVAVDRAGDAYVVGTVSSADFPATPDALQPTYNGGSCPDASAPIGGSMPASACPDAFLMKVTRSGNLAYATYFGGTGWDEGARVAVDDGGYAVIAGHTRSLDLPVAQAMQSGCRSGFWPQPCGDAFVARIDPAGRTLVFSTYVGGTDFEAVTAVAVGDDGAAYVSGGVGGSGFPFYRGPQGANGGGVDGFVLALTPFGQLRWSSYFGGEGDDRIIGVGVGGGLVQIAGETMSAQWLPAGFRGARDLFSIRVLDAGR